MEVNCVAYERWKLGHSYFGCLPDWYKGQKVGHEEIMHFHGVLFVLLVGQNSRFDIQKVERSGATDRLHFTSKDFDVI